MKEPRAKNFFSWFPWNPELRPERLLTAAAPGPARAFIQALVCLECGARDCPHGEPLHYHHDGCPACSCDTETR